jgi:SPP1 gp7 family putative phage head morphogenesis protein
METRFDIAAPHIEAQQFIEDKTVVTRDVFDRMLPELRARAFTITGVEAANVMQRVRDTIAGVATGETWDDTKASIVDQLDAVGFSEEGAALRAETLMRTHGFQAFQAANWRVAQEDPDTTHLQYLATEDDRVRETHLALNGIVLPKDDDFWTEHYPPWEWGCRCRVRAMNPDLVDEAQQADQAAQDAGAPPENANVLEGAALDQLNNGTLIRDGQTYDVSPPSAGPDGASAFRWNPDDLRLPLEELRPRYDPEVFNEFEAWAKQLQGRYGNTLWDYLDWKRQPKIQKNF